MSDPASRTRTLTLGPPRRFAPVGDGDPVIAATIGYIELREGERPKLPI